MTRKRGEGNMYKWWRVGSSGACRGQAMADLGKMRSELRGRSDFDFETDKARHVIRNL